MSTGNDSWYLLFWNISQRQLWFHVYCYAWPRPDQNPSLKQCLPFKSLLKTAMIKPGPHPKTFLKNKNLLGREVEVSVYLKSIASVNMSSWLTYFRIAWQTHWNRFVTHHTEMKRHESFHESTICAHNQPCVFKIKYIKNIYNYLYFKILFHVMMTYIK